ncbi:hypothetical protein BTO06_13730 [Tenacibaculum sp. SZ-18]|uniref:hypothetical protein n=1 Tax=Tenacibaculum sp. SZ-18 TaxID=754423 RepID=UPI000C2D4365|nr:hypothetical protein [Tenacibaculum sp. SZ-18]AUC16154.1 hypothetical protein BTO06_13730 [Tenacibaculum sp. SZ-18]
MATILFTPGTKFGTVTSSTIPSQKIKLMAPSIRPLSPSITAQMTGSGSGEKVVLSAVVFVSEANLPANNQMTFDINYLVTDLDKVSIYIASQDSFTPSNVFYPFVVEIEFSPSQVPNLSNNLSSIKVINWDADPEGSRGTEIRVGG